MAEENEQQIGPPSPTFLTLVLKTFAGLGGGIAGTLVLLVIFLGASSILQSAWNPEVAADGAKNPLFIFIFMAMIFLTSMIANFIGSLLFTFVEHEKYNRTSTAMYQIFFVNVVIFVITAPVYIFLDARGLLDMTGFLAGFHVVLSTVASAMILEIIGDLKYALVGVYGVIFSVLISTGLLLTVYQLAPETNRTTVLLFASLPALWAVLGFVSVIVEMLYRWLYTIYGRDFLMSKTEYGQDYGEEEPEEAPPPPDVSGSEFLGK